MPRRVFLKWLLAALAAAGSCLALFPWLSRLVVSLWPVPTGEVPGAAPGPEPDPEERPTAVSAEPMLSFFVLSDLHVSMYDESTSRKLRNALEQIVHLDSPADALLLGGDLTDYGMDTEYKALEAILAAYKLPPVYASMGNHEYYHVWIQNGGFSRDTFPNGKTDAQSRDRFMGLFNYTKPYKDVVMNGCRLILMSQEAYREERPEVGEGAWYSDEQLAWLRAKLRETTDAMPIFIVIHQPLPSAGQDGGTHQLIRAKEFRDILKPHKNVFVFSGHTHQDFDDGTSHYSKETFHWLMNASVGRTRNRGEAERSQGLYVQVFEDRVVVRGKEFADKAWLASADWTIPLERVGS